MYFSSLIYLISLTMKPLPVYSVRVRPRAFPASQLLASLVRTLTRLIIKKFSHYKKLTTTTNLSISGFTITFYLLACKSIMSDGLKLFAVQNLHCDNDSWIYPKTTILNFQPYRESPLLLTNNLMQAFIFFVQIVIDFSQPFIQIIFISFRPLLFIQ